MRWTIFLLVLTHAGAVGAQGISIPQEALRGLDGVTLYVQPPDSSFIDHGITADVIRAPVELLLRESGIPVLDSGDPGSYEGNPVLYVAVTGVLDDGMRQYAYRIQIELTQEAALHRDASILVPDATTWRDGGMAVSGPQWRQSLLEDVRFYAEGFVEAYWTSNQSE